ncbi:MAG: Mth938-like domain-containing protein [Rhodospirillales bacterium]|nr:Mth938-like domain-containing protein [Rhodospirillales bacterium]
MSLDITPLVPTGRQMIESYGGGGFVIAGARYAGSVIVLPERTFAWAAASAADVTELGLVPLFAAPSAAEILVVGCGPHFTPPPVALRPAIKARGIALEWMDTGAACRTFNVLLAEGRLAAAALIAVP